MKIKMGIGFKPNVIRTKRFSDIKNFIEKNWDFLFAEMIDLMAGNVFNA
jgi:hypothetical protein